MHLAQLEFPRCKPKFWSYKTALRQLLLCPKSRLWLIPLVSDYHASPMYAIGSREQGFSSPGLSTCYAEGWQVSSWLCEETWTLFSNSLWSGQTEHGDQRNLDNYRKGWATTLWKVHQCQVVRSFAWQLSMKKSELLSYDDDSITCRPRATGEALVTLPKHQQSAYRQRNLLSVGNRNFAPASNRLHTCGSTEHLAWDCKSHKGEGTVSASPNGRPPNARTRMVTSVDSNDPIGYMFSFDSDKSEVSMVRQRQQTT